ncbi:hypothetical protein EYF80_030915 [Liparis tanakae]|uniref:Uncharacterized protein n=1 Tax=Liparis tanakae TaxID=230148 RepID=A0A4Z2H0N1_9TELE|nr:hypothetical protein EYF80_030915 [Liparis tanakae]
MVSTRKAWVGRLSPARSFTSWAALRRRRRYDAGFPVECSLTFGRVRDSLQTGSPKSVTSMGTGPPPRRSSCPLLTL